MVPETNKRLNQAGIFVSLFCLFLFCSCGDKEVIVASVGDQKLTRNEAYILMEHYGYDLKDDSLYREFIDNWVDEQVYLQELKKSEPESYELVALRSLSYQAQLAKDRIEQNYFGSKLDTLVSEEEIKRYYDQHKKEFILHDYIVKALYLKIPASVDFEKKKIQTKFLLKNGKDLKDVNSYAKLYAENYYYNDSGWIYFAQLAKDIPLSRYNVDNIILNRTKTYFSDENHTYFLNIIDYKLKDEAPPLEFLKEQIKELIVNMRLQDLREKSEIELLKELKEKHEIITNY